ncbi:FAD-dependent oxidoreductase [Cellulomonas taurus]|uniref:FAD-dependent oxidoreductase n=1 Tax=Cellulomonas taurus TaxID=2729175 RepID=UPI00145EB6AD|nr:FAD-dependent oxidoreductase [Cellulomonas taurus]
MPTVCVVGAGPAGIYAAHLLTRARPDVTVDLLEKLPVPYGLVRYGVAPDHPRIKRIVDSLHELVAAPAIRLLCDVEVGRDVTVDQLRARYDAVVLATGADRDALLDVPGHDLPGSYGAADFVAWYDAHPDAAPSWPLRATDVAVIGAGNVALDITRMLAKPADALVHTDIPDHVHAGLADSRLRDVHLFARRGPADTRFSPLELRELGEQPEVDVIVDPAEVDLDEHGRRMVAQFGPKRQIVDTLQQWASREPTGAARRVHLHFYRAPVRVDGTDRVTGVTVERTAPDPLGRVSGTGEQESYPVQAVYRAVGYTGSPVPGVPFDPVRGSIPHRAGRVLDDRGEPVPGLYATGWIKRGPVGLIGSTKSDAKETVESLVEDLVPNGAGQRVDDLLTRRPVGWAEWLRVDAAELAAGAARGRERTKFGTRDQILAAAWERG